MKRIVLLVSIAFTTLSIAQEAVKLRLNYKSGDQYLMEMSMKQDSPVMAMNMQMNSTVAISNAKDGNYLSEMKFTKIAMDMMQGGTQMSASTDDKDEDLDAIGKQVKSQLSQMLAVTISRESDKRGNVLTTKISPNLPGVNQMTNQAGSIVYPEKALRVGGTWTDEKTEQGVVTKTTYKVASISKSLVVLDVTGALSGTGKGTISGAVNIDRVSGVPTSSSTKIEMDVQGISMKMEVNITMKKVI